MHGKTKPDLNALLAKASLAAEDFKSLDNDPEEGIRYRNAGPHSAFLSLQTELKIPSIAEGRAFSLQFYYGRVTGAIHDVLVRRETFTKCPDDADKIHTYIAHRGANHPDVVAFKLADDQQKDIEKNASAMCQAFDRNYREVTPKGSIKPPWMTESTYRVLQHQPLVARSRLDVEERDRLHTIVKGDFCRYYHNVHQHTIINFYTAARNYDSKFGYPGGELCIYSHSSPIVPKTQNPANSLGCLIG